VPTDLENSFTLLAAYDTAAQGGNGDGVIGAADAVFGRLRLWVDANHDGGVAAGGTGAAGGGGALERLLAVMP
jgi:hypothetical protein